MAEMKERLKNIENRLDNIEKHIYSGESGKMVHCNKCNYQWNSKTKRLLVSCPYCGSKVKVKP